MKTFACAFLLTVFAVCALAADVTGKWSGTFEPEGQSPSNCVVILKQAGSKVTGSAGPDEGEQWPLSDGKIEGNKLTGNVTSPDGVVYKLDLVLQGDHVKGNVLVMNGRESMKAKVDVVKAK
jgi:hypothetical protein